MKENKTPRLFAGGIALGAVLVLLIAATPIKNLVLQGDMDGGGHRINNISQINGWEFPSFGTGVFARFEESYNEDFDGWLPVYSGTDEWLYLMTPQSFRDHIELDFFATFAPMADPADGGVIVQESGSDPDWLPVPTGGNAKWFLVATTDDDDTTFAWRSSANALSDIGGVSLSGSYANPAWITGLAWSKITTTPTTLSGYGITDGVANTRNVSTGSGLTGGGNLSADRTLAVDSTVIRTTGTQTIGGQKSLTDPYFVYRRIASLNVTAGDWVQLGRLHWGHVIGNAIIYVQTLSSANRASALIEVSSAGYGSTPNVTVKWGSSSSLPEISGVRIRRVGGDPTQYVDIQLARTADPAEVNAAVLVPISHDLFHAGSWVWVLAHNPDTSGTTTLQTLTLPAQSAGMLTSAGLTVTGAATLSSTLTVAGAATLNGQPSYASASSASALTKSMGDAGYQAKTETKATTGDFGSGNFEGRTVINTEDNTFKVYAEGAWREIVTW